MAKLVDALL